MGAVEIPRFLYDFDFDDGTITSLSEASADLADDNVVNDLVGKKWRSGGDDDEWVKFDLGAATTITDVSIFGHNLTDAATVTLCGHAANLGDLAGDWIGTATYDTAFDWNSRNLVQFPAASNNLQWWFINFDDAANPDTYIEIGRICAGSYVSLGMRYFVDWKKDLIDPSESDITEGRQKYHLEKEEYWLYNLMMKSMNSADRDTLETLFRAVKNVNPLVVHFAPTGDINDDTIYCEITTPMATSVKLINRGDVRMQLEEKL